MSLILSSSSRRTINISTKPKKREDPPVVFVKREQVCCLMKINVYCKEHAATRSRSVFMITVVFVAKSILLLGAGLFS